MTARPGPVVVLGDANVDLVLHVPERSPGGRREVREPLVGPGGTAANTARGLASLGVATSFVGAVGDDAFGREITAELARAGVDTSGVHVTREAATCQVIAMLEPDGERSLVVWPADGGALRWLLPQDVAPERIAGAAWLHTTGMCLRDAPVRDTVLATMAAARAAGVPASIDLNLRVELWGLDEDRRAVVEQAIALADVVFGSGPEELVPLARALAGADLGEAGSGGEVEADEAEAVEAEAVEAEDVEVANVDRVDGTAIETAAATLAAGSRTVIARLGGEGAIACGPTGATLRVPGLTVDARNIIGAGDAFNAGFIAAMVAGEPLETALRWGNAEAALHIARDKGTPPPTRAELDERLA